MGSWSGLIDLHSSKRTQLRQQTLTVLVGDLNIYRLYSISNLACLIPDSPVTFTMKQTVSLPTPVQVYRPESFAVASRICSTSCSMTVRLLAPRELPSLVQVMVPVAGRGQLSFSTSPGCTEHNVGLEIWYLLDASAERSGGGDKGGREEERQRTDQEEKGAQGRWKVKVGEEGEKKAV